MFQNQWQRNYSFAQSFIYGNNIPNIIVGSSLANRMKNKFLSQDFFNLSFSGGSALTGLEIIKKSGFIPKNIYIENNIIFRHKDKEMLNFLFYPIWWQIKKYIPALREKYQPLNLVLSKIKGSYGKTHEERMKDTRNDRIFEMNIKKYEKGYNTKLKNHNKRLENLTKLITYFEKKGTNIIFFEMPVDERLANSFRYKQQREIIKNNFNNKWLKLPESNNYITTDGIHLLYKSAYKYSKEFLHQHTEF